MGRQLFWIFDAVLLTTMFTDKNMIYIIMKQIRLYNIRRKYFSHKLRAFLALSKPGCLKQGFPVQAWTKSKWALVSLVWNASEFHSGELVHWDSVLMGELRLHSWSAAKRTDCSPQILLNKPQSYAQRWVYGPIKFMDNSVYNLVAYASVVFVYKGPGLGVLCITNDIL